MKTEDAEEYTQSLGQIVAGGWRQIALGERLGVPKALGLTTKEWVEQRLGGYVKLSIDERHGAVKELKADGMSTRQIAGVLGIGKSQVSEIGQPEREGSASTEGSDEDGVRNRTDVKPIDALAALAAGKAVDKQVKRREREETLRAERMAKEEAAKANIALLDKAWEIVVADVGEWRPSDVDSIITDPPYVGDAIPLYEKLRDFAVDVLPEGAPLIVMTWQAILPAVIDALRHDALAYRWAICWRYANVENTVDHTRRVFDCWKPILVYHKGVMPPTAAQFRDEIANEAPDKDHHEWGQSLSGFERLIRSFSEPGQLICDPFLGAGTTALAALSQSRRFTGCDVDASAIESTRARLESRDEEG